MAQFKWHAVNGIRRWYAVRREKREGKWCQVRMHRFILGVSGDVLVDHENGNGLDNQRHNIRPANALQNSWNKDKPKNNRSGYKGIFPCSRTAHWRARVCVAGKFINLGSHKTKEEAARAYDAAARRYFGEFANTNF